MNAETINKILGITEAYKMPEVLSGHLFDCEKRGRLFDEFMAVGEALDGESDKREYEEYKGILRGKATESFEKFLRLKYNDDNRYEQLNRECKTIREIENNNIRFYDLLRVVTNENDDTVIMVVRNKIDVSKVNVKNGKWVEK